MLQAENVRRLGRDVRYRVRAESIDSWEGSRMWNWGKCDEEVQFRSLLRPYGTDGALDYRGVIFFLGE